MSHLSSSSNPSIPTGLHVETGGSFLPISSSAPELSWMLPSGMARQEGFDLEARIGEEVLSYHEDTDKHRFIRWPLRELRSTEAVDWRVRLYGQGRPTSWSEWSRFEAGLFEEDWTAQWISSPKGSDLPLGARPAYALSKEFILNSPVTGARLYASALGVYEVFINGQRAGHEELAPGTESYDMTLYAQAYDVAVMLRPGPNTIEVLVSDGWYRGRSGAFRHQAAWGTDTAIRAELHIRAEQRTVVAVATDLSWRVSDSNIVQADLMDGQITDLTHVPRVIGAPVPGPMDIPAVSWSPSPPVRVVQEIQPVGIKRLSDDTLVFDFGQNASGRVRLSSLGPRGSRTLLHFAEHVDPQGDITLTHLDSPSPHGGPSVPFVQHDEVVSDGDPSSIFEPRHTVHGFRYVKVQRPGLVLHPSDITMQVMHSDLEKVGSFACSDPDLEALYNVADWSFRGNAVDIPTDCPTRERSGWTGDWQIFLPTATRLYDVDGFSRKWLQAVRDDQLGDGRIANMSPDNARLRVIPDPMSDMATGSAGWGDAIVLVPWELYRTYGDRSVLEESWDAMKRWIDFALKSAATKRHPSRVVRSEEPLTHEKYLWDGTFHFGEWCEPTPLNEDGTPGPTMPDPMAWAMADKGEVGTAYLYRSLDTMAKIADELDRLKDAAIYAETAEKVRDAWRKEFLDEEGRTAAGTQASYVRGLAFDLIPADLRASASGHLVELIRAAGNHLGTGFLSTADLLPVLADAGHPDVAHDLLLQRTTPSWLGMIDRGATTIWEEWEGIDRNGNASASLNHYSKGAVIRFLQTHTLGMQQAPASVAWESFIVAPVPPTHVSWARGHFDSPQGRIDIEWHEEGQDALLKVSVPAGSRATLRWGGQETSAAPGVHELRAAIAAIKKTPAHAG